MDVLLAVWRQTIIFHQEEVLRRLHLRREELQTEVSIFSVRVSVSFISVLFSARVFSILRRPRLYGDWRRKRALGVTAMHSVRSLL